MQRRAQRLKNHLVFLRLERVRQLVLRMLWTVPDIRSTSSSCFSLTAPCAVTARLNIPLMPGFLKALEETAPVSLAVLVSVSLVQSAILLLIAVVVDAFLAPRLGLASHLVQLNNDSFSKELPFALIAGLVTAGVALILEAFFSVFVGVELEQLNQAVPRDMLTTLAGIFFGGFTEEILMRWGLLSFVAFVFWKLFNRNLAKPGVGVMWSSIILVAVIFGISHGCSHEPAPMYHPY